MRVIIGQGIQVLCDDGYTSPVTIDYEALSLFSDRFPWSVQQSVERVEGMKTMNYTASKPSKSLMFFQDGNCCHVAYIENKGDGK